MATFRGNSKKETIIGGSGNDSILGQAGDDSLKGMDGNDTLNGGNGKDTLNGGNGNDLMEEFRNSGSDRMDGSAGNDTVNYTRNDNGLLPITLNVTTSSVTRLNSSTGQIDKDILKNIERVIATSSTNDVISAQELAAKVTINLSNGTISTSNKSTITTISRFEHATGGTLDDVLTSSTADNTLDGQAGNDRYVFLTGFGNDTVIDGEGKDTIDLSNLSQGFTINLTSSDGHEVESDLNADTIDWEGSTIEVVTGSSSADKFYGSVNDETLFGAGGNDTFYQITAHGNDVIDGGGGSSDTLDYSQSTQKIVYDTAGNQVSSFDSSGNLSSLDTFTNIEVLIGSNNVNSIIDASNQSSAITLNLLSGTASNLAGGLERISGFNGVEGGSGNDNIAGNNNGNFLNGNDGNDSISGEAGNDTLNGGEGDDTLDGGSGSDTFIYDDDWGRDNLINSIGYNDVVDLSLVSEKLIVNLTSGVGNEVEDVPDDASAKNTINWDGDFVDGVITGSKDDMVTGSSLANSIITKRGNDTVFGGGGNDTISGGSGSDSLSGEAGNDSFVFTDNEEPTLEQDTIDGGDDIDLLDFRLLTTAVTYNSASSTVEGKRLLHSVSNIELIVGSTLLGDTIDASGESNDLQIVLSHLPYSSQVSSNGMYQNLNFSGSNIISVFEGFENITAGSGNDTIVTNDAKNIINGGMGNDLILEDYNADTYVFDDGWGDDTIYRPLNFDYSTLKAADIEDKINEIIAGGGLYSRDLEIRYDIAGGYADPEEAHDRLDFSSVTSNLTVYLTASYERDEVTDGVNYLNWVENRSAYGVTPASPKILFEEVATGFGDDDIFGNSAENVYISGAGDDIVRDFDTGLDIIGVFGAITNDILVVNGISMYKYAAKGTAEDSISLYDSDITSYTDVSDGYYDAGGNDIYYDGAGSDYYNDAILLDVSGTELPAGESGGDDTYVFVRSTANAQAGANDYIYDPAPESFDNDTILFSGFSPSDFIVIAERGGNGLYVTDLKFICEVYGAPWTITVLNYFTGNFIDDDTLKTNPEGNSIYRGNGSMSQIVFDPNGDTNADLTGGTDDDITMTIDNLVEFISF